MTIQTPHLLNIVHNLAQHTKAPPDSLLKELGLLPAQVEDLNAYLPWEIFQKALDLALLRTGNLHFGLTIGFNANPLIMGQELGLFMQVCPDFRTVATGFCHYSRVMGEMTSFFFQEKRSEPALRFKGITAWRQASFQSYRAGMELYAAATVTLSRQLTQNAVQIIRLEFDYPRTDDLENAYRQAFGKGIEVRFDCAQCGVVFSPESLHLKNPFFQETLFNRIKSNLEILVDGYRQAIPLSRSIQMLLEETYFQPREKEFPVEKVARRFNHSVRQLQRELKAQNLSFHLLRNEVKKNLADRFLLYKTNQELADLLKFADVPAFVKWFKTQFDQPPDHLRHERRK
jgi:AraC-like DNA-binding protein